MSKICATRTPDTASRLFLFLQGEARVAFGPRQGQNQAQPSFFGHGNQGKRNTCEIKALSFSEAIRAARSVYVGSFKITRLCEYSAGRVGSDGAAGHCSWIRGGPTHAGNGNFRRCCMPLRISVLASTLRRPDILVFVNDDEREAIARRLLRMSLKRRSDLQGIAKAIQVRLLHYTKNSVDLYSTFDGEPAVRFSPGCIPTLLPATCPHTFAPE